MKRIFWKNWPWVLLIVAVAIGVSGLEGLLTLFTMHAVDSVYGGNTVAFYNSVKQMIFIALALVPLTVILAGVRGLYKKSAIVKFKHFYMQRLFMKNMSEFQKDNNARYLSAVTNDLNTIETSYIDSIYEIIVNLVSFIVGVLIVGTVSPYALVVGVLVGIISTLLSVWIGKPLQKHQKHRSEMFSDFTAYIKEALSAFHIIKANELTEKVRMDYYKRSHYIQQKGYIIDKIITYVNALNRFNFNIAFFALIGFTAYMGIKGELSIGGVILVVTSMDKIMQPIGQLSDLLPKIFGTKSVFQRLDDSLKNSENLQEVIQLERFENCIQLQNLTFAYEDNAVLSNVSLTLEKGKKYLIVGPSGGGKSTLLKLLRKYYSPQQGIITLDQQSFESITKESYFSKIANVEQQVFIFEDTIRNNLTLYKPYDLNDILAALEAAGLSTFLDSLDEGLETMLYDNGKNLSGGERSRLAIARAILQKAEIVFMDEAFSSLDYETAMGIEETLLSLTNVTLINVSHVTFTNTRGVYDSIITVKNKKIYEKRKSA